MAGELFLGREPNDQSFAWKEWHLQAYAVQELRRLGYLVHGDQNAGKRNPGKAAASGMLAGFPDLSVWVAQGRVVLFELKRDAPVSKVQSDLHDRFRKAGFSVFVVRAKTPHECFRNIYRIIVELGLKPDGDVARGLE